MQPPRPHPTPSRTRPLPQCFLRSFISNSAPSFGGRRSVRRMPPRRRRRGRNRDDDDTTPLEGSPSKSPAQKKTRSRRAATRRPLSGDGESASDRDAHRGGSEDEGGDGARSRLRARPIAAPPTPSAMHDDKRRRRRALSATGRGAASEVRGKGGPRGTHPSATGSTAPPPSTTDSTPPPPLGSRRPFVAAFLRMASSTATTHAATQMLVATN